MELQDVLRSTNTCRYFRPDPVENDVLVRTLGAARFAPSGGNRQPVRFVVVRDPDKRKALGDLYVPIWETYLAAATGGSIDVSGASKIIKDADHFARNIAKIPVVIVVGAKLADVHPTDDKLGRLSVVGGASIYPAVHNVLLTARSEGLGTALTTLLCEKETLVKTLLKFPDDISIAATVMMGYPVHPFPKKLTRRSIDESTFADEYGEPISEARS